MQSNDMIIILQYVSVGIHFGNIVKFLMPVGNNCKTLSQHYFVSRHKYNLK